jgi:hypothetical protein
MLNQTSFTDVTCWQHEASSFIGNCDNGFTLAGMLPNLSNEPLATLGAINGARQWEARYHGEDSADRRAIEDLIREKYQAVHGAKIEQCLPHLFSIRTPGEPAAGAVGIRMMEMEGGLLERYLDRPIETILSHVTGEEIKRDRILEVGNLAAENIQVAVLLIAFLFEEAERRARSHAVFTGTHALRMALKRAKVPYHTIQTADAEKLGAEKDHWGRYYNCDPQIMAVNVKEGLEYIRRRFWLSRESSCGS